MKEAQRGAGAPAHSRAQRSVCPTLLRSVPLAGPRPGAASTKWAGLVAGEGWSQSDNLLGFLLLLDSQDSGVQDLQPSPKQLMEAPLQTGMVRVEGCVAPQGLQFPTCSARIIAVPREPDCVCSE